MYQNFELSKMAKALTAQLANQGIKLPHALSMEVLARVVGARTLHAKQAADSKEIDLQALAWADAQKRVFEQAGDWDGKVPELIEKLDAAFGQESSRDIESSVYALLKSTKLTRVADRVPTQELSSLLQEQHDLALSTLSSMVGLQTKAAAEKGKELLQFAVGLAEKEGCPEAAEAIKKVFGLGSSKEGHLWPLFEGFVQDWRVKDKVDVPVAEQTVYEAKVNRGGDQFYLDFAPPHRNPEELEGTPALSLVAEINEGLPCVHLSNNLYGDIVLTIFLTAEGLFLRPAGRLTPAGYAHTKALKALYAKESPFSPDAQLMALVTE